MAEEMQDARGRSPSPGSRMKKDSLLIVIPARAGSKRLPGKNLIPLMGRPLIEWTIGAAVEANVGTSILVTSDSAEVLSIAGGYSGIRCLQRSPDLASDTASSVDVVIDALQHEEREGRTYDSIMLLQPTSPLRTAHDISDAYATYLSKGQPALVSVTPLEHPVEWTSPLSCDGVLTELSVTKNLRTSTPELRVRLNGAIYLIRMETFRDRRTFFVGHVHGYSMPQERSVDIDTWVDFELCRAILEKTS